ncbi:O-antigen ligase family protein [Rhizobium terrae]|uniref:O-antigen ligase family protein n=1 Tax=Rhizobium terrae TaxID=2171756 RepID=UPI0013C33CCD|nr:O-antigen ligase family protein [Rhizobium terrae]
MINAIVIVLTAVCCLLSYRYRGLGIVGIFYCYTAETIVGIGVITPVVMLYQLIINTNFRSIASLTRISAIDISVYFFICVILLSPLWSTESAYSLDNALKTTLVLLSFYIICRLAIFNIGAERLAYEFAVAFTTLGAGFAVLAILAAPKDPVGLRFIVGEGAAVGLAQPLPYALFSAFFLIGANWRRRALIGLPAILSVAIVSFYAQLNGTRGVVVALTAGLICYLSIAFYRASVGRKLFSTFVVAGMILLTISFWSTFQPNGNAGRLLNFSTYGGEYDSSSVERRYRFKAAENIFLDQPVFGVGAGGFHLATGLGYPHNLFLEIASEFGVIGLLSLAFIILAVVLAIVRGKLIYTQGMIYFVSLASIAFVHQQISFSLSAGKAMFIIGVLGTLKPTKCRPASPRGYSSANFRP